MRDDGSLNHNENNKDSMKELNSGNILKVECFRGPKTTFKSVDSLQGLIRLNSSLI